MAADETHLLNLAESEFPEMISINIICRLCANQSDKLIGIYSEDGINNDLAGKLNLYLPIKVSESDNLPLQCCWQCASTVLAWHDLVITSVEADRRLRSYQLVSEKQLEEISSTYGEAEHMLATSAEETFASTEEKDDVLRHESVKQQQLQKRNESEAMSPEFLEPEEIDTAPDNKPVNFSSNPHISTTYIACEICKEIFPPDQLNLHLQQAHATKVPRTRRKKNEIVRSFECSRCEKAFTKRHDLSRHLVNKHDQESVTSNTRSQHKAILNACRASDNLYRCEVCLKAFIKSSNLLRHRTIHSDTKLYCCNLCDKSFRLSTSLTRHISEVHQDKRNFICEVCKKAFKNKWSLDEHSNIHTDSRPYVCDICGKSFRQSASLYVHKQYHYKNYPHECTICQKRFPRKNNLLKHHQVHTGQKNQSCQKCGSMFGGKQALKRHSLKCHLSLACEKCGSTFEQMRYLKLHTNHCSQSLDGIKISNSLSKSRNEDDANTNGVIIRNDRVS